VGVGLVNRLAVTWHCQQVILLHKAPQVDKWTLAQGQARLVAPYLCRVVEEDRALVEDCQSSLVTVQLHRVAKWKLRLQTAGHPARAATYVCTPDHRRLVPVDVCLLAAGHPALVLAAVCHCVLAAELMLVAM
jgi:hypothetical protein